MIKSEEENDLNSWKYFPFSNRDKRYEKRKRYLTGGNLLSQVIARSKREKRMFIDIGVAIYVLSAQTASMNLRLLAVK